MNHPFLIAEIGCNHKGDMQIAKDLIATAALFLASDEGAYINSHDLVVDGGMIAGGRTSFETVAPGANV